jgi:hypothetical protein
MSEHNLYEGLHVIPPEQVEKWRRQDRIDALFAATGRVIVRLAWWSCLFFAGYLAALIITAKSGV